mmetsp:Transcript_10321/g.28176  ORF Transcript_10321/g.28176 Transcript_10321/m.28176 type:complete len:247 (+) Transcript_10321:48-788(+)|eukprot:CAMPEP_0202352158 /NCGR_PEP_ID=MMETSP1126-20121109/8473_1 /ASSEMBLY_ACC=CAM_ASM_000457 /TAXON_ID=3047 /ORGANISM="Dunaliella tertiolecta, Strain CCMP1320" /LENGTH=246 /DNA_ID=CAMNT_0048944335 /DNA_START=40 /DNA_END=780 /DNA_ORIENTATION=-
MLQIQQRVNISGQACRSGLPARPNLAHAARPGASPSLPRRRVILKAQEEDPDAALEARLARLREAKGATPYNQGAKSEAAKPQKTQAGEKPQYNFEGETLYYEGPPHRGDLLVNLALGTTLLWLPLTIAAIGRAAFVWYRFTDKRLSVKTTAPWSTEQTDVAYQEVKEIKSVGRGVGIWGDMVVVLNDDSKVEMRSLDRFLELKDYILKRRDELAPTRPPPKQMAAELTQEELLGEEPSKKGFARK